MLVGDVIRYTANWSGDLFATPEVWVIVVSIRGERRAKTLSGGFHSKDEAGKVHVIGGEDAWEGNPGRSVVPPEEWPDEICAAVAMHNLSVV